MIARGDIEARGVLPPETVINPGIFFAELEKRGITIKQEVEQKTLIRGTYEPGTKENGCG
jgi:hypothetical protein